MKKSTLKERKNRLCKVVYTTMLLLALLILQQNSFAQTTLWSTGFESGDLTVTGTANATTITTAPDNQMPNTGSQNATIINSAKNKVLDGVIYTGIKIHFVAGTCYSVSVWARTTNCESVTLRVGKAAVNTATTLTGLATADQILFPSAVNVIDNAYSQYVAVFTATATEDKYVGFEGAAAASGGGLNCKAALLIDDITIQQIPAVASITNNVPICANGSSITLSDATGPGTWSGGTAGVATVNSSTGVVTPGATAGSTTINYTNGCGSTGVLITVLNTPAVSPTSTLICPGTTITYTGSPGGGTWTSTAAGIATITIGTATTGTVTGVATGLSVISYGQGGCYATFTQAVDVGPTAISISPVGPVNLCSSGPAQSLVATGGIQSYPAGSYTISSGTINVPIPGTATTVAPASTTINIPVGSIPSEATITSASVTFSTNGLAGNSADAWQSDYSFVLKGPNGNSISLTSNNVGTTNGNGKHNANLELANVSYASDAVNVMSSGTDLSNTTWIADLSNPAPNYWTANQSNSGAWSSIWGTPNGNWTLYSAAGFSADNNVVSIANWSITINYAALPATQDPVTWTPAGVGSGLYTDADAINTYTGTNLQTVYALPSGNTVYTATASNGTCSSTTTVSVNVTTTPTITLGLNPSVTQGTTSASLPFSAVGGTPTTYSIVWDGPTFAAVTNAAMPSTSPFTINVPAVAPAAVYSGTLTVKNAGGCTSTPASFTVTITAAGAVPTITLGSSPKVCASATSALLPFTGVTGTPTTYSIIWDAAAQSHSFNAVTDGPMPGTSPFTIAIPGSAPAAVYNGTVTVKNASGTSTPALFTVTVNALPDVSSFAISAADICSGSETVNITSSTLVNGTSYNVTYTLTSAVGNTGTFTDGSMAFGSGTGTFTIPSGRISNPGATTVTVNSIANATTLCSSTVSTGNVANFTINGLPTIALGPDPSVETGTTSGYLSYTATTGSPVSYTITWDGTAHGQSFTDVTDAAMPGSSPIILAVPAGAAIAVYTGTITVKNAGACTSTSIAFTLSVTSIVSSVTGCTRQYAIPSSTASVFNVPPGVTSVQVSMQGGSGGAGGGLGSGGKGGAVVCNLSVTDGTALDVYVGGAGQDGPFCTNGGTCGISHGGNGGFGGCLGGKGGDGPAGSTDASGGGGGGSSEIRFGGAKLIVAAGGGGGGGAAHSGGDGGGGTSGAGAPGIGGATGGGGGGAPLGGNGSAGTGSVAAGVIGSAAAGGIGGTGAPRAGGGGGGGVNGGGGGGGGSAANSGSGGGGANKIDGAGVSAVTTNSVAATAGDGIVSITILSTPALYTVTTPGSPTTCDGSGVSIGLSNSEYGVNYQLQKDGVNTGSPVTGTGAALNFGSQAVSGTYSVIAYYTGYSNCTTPMSGPIVVNIASAPTITLGTSPTVNLGSTTAPLPYTATTNTPTTYSITWDATAVGVLFADVTDAAMPGSSPINVTIPGTAPAAVYNGTITVKNAAGCVSGGTAFTVTINNSVPTITLGTSPSVCFGSTEALLPYTGTTGSPVTYSIVWDATATGQSFAGVTDAGMPGSSPISVTIPATASAAIYNGTITVKNGSAVSSVDNPFTVTVNPLPAITTGANPVICSGATTAALPFSATTNTPTTYSIIWDGTAHGQSFVDQPDINMPGSSPISLVIPSAATAATYSGSITVKNANGCISTPSAIGVTINELPSSFTDVTAGSGPVCVGGSIALTATAVGGNGATYVWTGPGSSTINNPTSLSTASITAVAIGDAGTYTVTASAAGCAGITVGTSGSPLVVHVLPGTVTASVTPNPACVNGTVTLSGGDSGDGVGVDYAWTGPVNDISSATSENASITSASLNDAGTYTLTATSVGCPGQKFGTTSALVVHMLPGTVTATVTPNPACVNGAVTLTGGDSGDGVGVGYAWTGPVNDISSATSENASITSASLNDAGTYTLTATSVGCPGQKFGTTSALVVHMLPGTVTATVTPNPACVNGAVTLTGGDSGDGVGVDYAWTGPVNDISSATSENASITSASLNDAGTYTLTATSVGCPGQKFGTTSALVVHMLPGTVTATVTPNPACVNGTVTLTGGDSGDGVGVGYAWTGPVNDISSATSENASITSVSLNDAGTYTLTATSVGCPGQKFGTTSALVVHMLPGTVTATVTPNPACVNGTVTLSGGDSGDGVGVDYAWTGPVNDISSATSENASITSASLNDAGTYTLTATSVGCPGQKFGTTSALVVHMLPGTVTATVTPNPACVNGTVTLTGGDSGDGVGVDYAWTGPVNDISSATSENASITSASLNDAGTYTLTATSVGCPGQKFGTTSALVVHMLPGTVTATVTPNPACVNGAVTLTGGDSGDGVGVDYAWTGPVNDISSATSENASITSASLNDAGTYTLTATSVGCPGQKFGTTSALVVHMLPGTVTATVTPNPACVNGAVTLTGGDSGDGFGVNYAWTGPVTAHISNASLESAGIPTVTTTDAGVYTLTATSGGCLGSTVGTSAALVVNTPPSSVAPTAAPNPLCVSFPITLTGNVTGGTALSYSWSGPISGIVNASALNTSIPSASLANNGTYTLTVTAAGCAPVSGSTALQVVNALPAIHTFTGGGGYCFGGTGVPVGLTLSDTGISYQLYMTGGGAVGNPVIGTGAAISFDTMLTIPGTYYAIATNIHTSCTSHLSGITVFINQLPTIYDVNGGGSYCTGGTGVAVGLANSETGVSYQLYNNGAIDGAPVAGSGSAISFGLQTAVGPYMVMATNNSTGCVSAMSGSAADTLLLPPTPFNVTGGGSFCLGDFTGLPVGLDSSETGVTYHLLYGGIIQITTKAGTGSSLNFGTQIAPGSYYVTAVNTTTGCADTMTGHVNVNVNIPPTPRLVTGGGSMCAVDSGFHIGLNGSTLGVRYQLYWGSTATVALLGTGNALDFGLIATAGTYTVLATDTASGCTTNMLGSATIIVNSVVIPTVSLVANPGIGNTVCYGVPVTFTGQTTNGGTAPVYVWDINGINPVTTDSTYNYIPHNGDVISVQVTSNAVCAIPDTASSTMIVDVDTAAAPSVFINVSPINSVAPGTSVTLTAVVTNGGSTVTYQWYSNGVPIAGATNSVYSSSTFANQDSITCQVISSSGCGPVTTFNSVVITVYPNGVAHVGVAAGEVTLIPNPNKGTFTVKGTMGTTLDEDVSIEITDMLGQVVYKSHAIAKGGVINQQIQLSNSLANGMYMLNLLSDTEHKVFHFVVEQ